MKKLNTLFIVIFLCVFSSMIFGQTYSISGIVFYDNSATSPIEGCTVYCGDGQGSVLWTTTTNATGNYCFDSLNSNLTDAVYWVGTSQIDEPYGVTNSSDALIIQQHFIGQLTLTGIRAKAADVNGSGYINTVDAQEVTYRFVGLQYNFVADWVLWDVEVTFPPSGDASVDIPALIYGDVDGSYFP